MALTPRNKERALFASAVIWICWGVLHLWVAILGVRQYLTVGTRGLWALVIGGDKVPRSAFVHTDSLATAYAQGHLILNFCLDVGGYGVLALIVAWLIWRKGSWAAYLIGLVVIGIGDLSFFFCMVTSGVIQADLATLIGPVAWLLACIVAPFGLPSLKRE